MSNYRSRSANAQRLATPAASYVAVDQAALQMLMRALAARYTALRQVSTTPLITTFWAEDISQGGFAILEVLTRRAALDVQQVELFYHEAAAAALLQHPHINRASSARRVAETHFRVTELVRGAESLSALLKRTGRFEPHRAGQIALQVSNALDFAHRRDVLHLQLQPAKILLDSNGEVIVSGFGIGVPDSLQWARQLRASQCPPAYLSPEQSAGGVGDRPSDLYALGMLLYEMLTDHTPHDEDDLRLLFRKKKGQTLRPPRDFNPEISVAFSDLVMALLSPNPALRTACYGNAEQFGALLRRVCEAGAAASRATNPLPPGELSAEVAAATWDRLQVPVEVRQPQLRISQTFPRQLSAKLAAWQPAFAQIAPWAALVLLLGLLPLFWLATSTARPRRAGVQLNRAPAVACQNRALRKFPGSLCVTRCPEPGSATRSSAARPSQRRAERPGIHLD